jgi:glycyl-tRNA synthetase alpha subunit
MELKPCPFCGASVATIWESPTMDCNGVSGAEYLVDCRDIDDGCGASVVGGTKAEAITAWNTRPTEQLQLAVEALEAVLDMIDGLYRNHDGWWLDDHDIAIARTSRDTLTRIKEATDADR